MESFGLSQGGAPMTRPLVCALVLVGCGTGGGGLDPEFTNTWNGVTTVAPSVGTPFFFPDQLKVSATGESAAITVCGGSLTASGTGDNASWTGSLHCMYSGLYFQG